MVRVNLDMDVLRTFVTAQDLGGFNRAATHLGRSQSAISQQMRKLEDQAGQPIFIREGRGTILTEQGERLLSYARRLLDLNDETLEAVNGFSVSGSVRFGLPGDFSESWLPALLGLFKRAHPGVLIEVFVERNGLLFEQLDQGSLDFVLAFGGGGRPDALSLGTLPTVWIGSSPDVGASSDPDAPIDLALYGNPCRFRRTGLELLDKAGTPWRLTFTSRSLQGLWAATGAGLGLTFRTPVGLPQNLCVLPDRPELPRGPGIEVCLHDGCRAMSPARREFRDAVIETTQEHLRPMAL
ncbi:LysR family transcriptional regulator [Novacetimonas pomaceti]|uniref:LysR family transcriptional regulator n=1 Tax=Novacetimonas pomaceti TaxID=2021998 RepID=UPI001C2DDD42|nr:LysR substrate-binding domain-containing protein [Novacetimonas pomaceti]MBV1834000.1 LysR family transcriptional regulator [Novacetimonas pomaceti]